ncbi:retinoic acid-induced protein 2 [Coregonus clupeaformis]|uniref:retinoic acid-induced protein 2 n=1 Tax=Coregonus clupeaformis TaxID=59861 RepID=UPI001E1C52FB|nr:retinoic acid-induced protein 2 [Coregonus clupeaformis]
MEDLRSEHVADPPQNGGSSGGGRGGGEGVGKVENTVTQLITSEASSIGSPAQANQKPTLSHMVNIPASPTMVSPSAEAPEGVALKVAATVLQPFCLGDSPVMLPIHPLQQMAGGTAPQGIPPYLLTHQGPLSLGSLSQGPGLSLPLVLEQHVFQHLNTMGAMLQQTPPYPSLSFLQNNLLCHTQPQTSSMASLAFCQPPALDQKLPGPPAQDPGIHALLQNPAFAALIQDLFSAQTNPTSPSCHPAGSTPTDPFASASFPPSQPQPPPLSYPYSSPLAPLVPPATLLVPYPVIVPLPVPLPIPLPLPIPVPQRQESKGFSEPCKPACMMTKSTQTNSEEIVSPPPHGNIMTLYPSSMASLSTVAMVPEGEVLDLSLKAPPIIQPKQEMAFQQHDDTVLDLSVASKQTVSRKERPSSRDWHTSSEGTATAWLPSSEGTTSVSPEVLKPAECTQKLHRHPNPLNGVTHVEFRGRRQWAVVDGGGSSNRPSSEPKCSSSSGSSNFEIFHTSQTAKVIVAVKDAIPTTAIFCGKIKSLSGVSRHHVVEQKDPNLPRNRQAIKLKKVSSQEIHILPIKKQRLAAFCPRK